MRSNGVISQLLEQLPESDRQEFIDKARLVLDLAEIPEPQNSAGAAAATFESVRG